ncbi:MAG: hypothetical protein ACI8UO_002184 [Verrucomicrobiales bacterium]|jgi:hypothetical protein
MRISIGDEQWSLNEIGPAEWTMLNELPGMADFNRSEKGRKRILPDPTGEDETDLVADWREFVVPELESQFTDSIAKVAHAIGMAEEYEEEEIGILRRVDVSKEDAEVWYQVLNQARLIMNEDHDLSRVEQEFFSGETEPTELSEEAMRLIMRNRFFAAIQEMILTSMMEID